MACIFGHKWDGCKCSKCGKIRNEGHEWDLCKGICTRCGSTQPVQHDWAGCTCKRCHATRNEGHLWNGCKCNRCGATRDEGHEWDGFVCKKCGQKKKLEMRADGIQQRLIVTENDVSINGKIVPLSAIKEVIVYPVEKNAPACGGCIKFVTDDNPGLPVRNAHSFEVPCSKDDTSNRPYTGMSLSMGNCFWFNCLNEKDCAKLNDKANEMKQCVKGLMAKHNSPTT